MVSLNSEVHPRKESSLMQKANRTKTAAGTAGSQLDKELAFLFGPVGAKLRFHDI